MEGAIIGRCVFKNKSAAIPIYADTSFMGLCSEVCSRFDELIVGGFQMTYVVLDHPPCLVKSDLDVRVLHLSLVNDKQNFVTIIVNEFQSSCEGDGRVNGIGSSFNIWDGATPSNTNDFLGKYAAPLPQTYLSHSWKTYINRVGQRFTGGVSEFRDKLRKYAIEKGFSIAFLKNEKERVTAECSKKLSEGCMWRVHATLCHANGFFYIRTLNNTHTCSGLIRERFGGMMSSKVVSSVLMEQASSKPMLKPTEIVKDFKKYYGLDISYYNAWYGKESAKKMMHGDESLSYNHLAWYVRAIESSNPGSHCVLECDVESSRFKRIFISFHGCIEGFAFCRPMLFLDGTFIKNKYKGHLLAATGKNGNQGIYPLAFAVVNSENEENWSWFLQNLSKIVTPQGRTITFISDRQKGLIEAVASVFPQSPHAFCYHHLKQNILLKYPSSLGKSYRDWIIQLFGKCAYAPTEDAFEMHMRTLMEEGGAVIRDFLKMLPKENWAAAHFPGPKYGEMCSNVAESFNAWIVDQRFLPIYQMLDGIRAKIMEMNAQRRRVAEAWKTFLCPEMETIMQDLMECGRHWDVGRSSEFLFEVHGEDSVMVDLQSRTCSCRMWQIKGFPCAHALAAILKSEGNPYEYIEDYFMVHFFKSCYDTPIVPIPDIDRYAQEENEEVLINPPLTRKPPGRPKVKRIKSSGERTRPITCSRCGTLGHHNKNTCTAEI